MRKPKQAIPAGMAAKVYHRDGMRCRYCGDTRGPFQLDHVYPESKGGETTINNLVVACSRCNNRKHAKIGVWPMPVGYFDGIDHSREREDLIHRMRNRLDSVAPAWWYGVMLIGVLMMAMVDFEWLHGGAPIIKSLGVLIMVGSLFATIGWEAKS